MTQAVWLSLGRFAATALIAYLCGSVPSGVLVGKLSGNVDPREHGSGKTGATNILRTLGPGAAILVAFTDVLKGAVPVLLASHFLYPGQPWAETVAGFGALVGHNYSVFIHFRGGRGVATGGGAIIAMNPLDALFGAFGFAVSVAVTRYVSLGSIVAATTCALAEAGMVVAGRDSYQHLVFVVGGAAFVVYSHRDNIERLLKGTERRLGQPSS